MNRPIRLLLIRILKKCWSCARSLVIFLPILAIVSFLILYMVLAPMWTILNVTYIFGALGITNFARKRLARSGPKAAMILSQFEIGWLFGVILGGVVGISSGIGGGPWWVSAFAAPLGGFLWLSCSAILMLSIDSLKFSRAVRLSLDDGVAGEYSKGLIAHVSDLHITGSTTLAYSIESKDTMANALQILNRASCACKWVALTGDITDTGSLDDWECLQKVWSSLKHPEKVLPIPGNHDLLLHSYSDQIIRLKEAQYEIRARRLIWFYKLVHSKDWKLLTRDGRLISVSELFAALNGQLTEGALSDECVRKAGAGVMPYPDMRPRGMHSDTEFHPYFFGSAAITSLFPILFAVDSGYAIVGLDSCRQLPRTIAANAFGAVGGIQLHKLKQMIEILGPSLRVIILCHHHVGKPVELSTILGDRFLRLADSRRLLRICRSAADCTILHGHEHFAYGARNDFVRIISAPSALYGDKRTEDRTLRYYV